MHKTVLVIGEVTRNQYQTVRLEIIRKGNQPKIVRITVDELLLDDEDLISRYHSPGADADELLELASNRKLVNELATRHVASYGPIAAVVMTQRAFEAWGQLGGGEAIALLLREHDNVRWVLGERGSLEFIGG